MEEKENFSIFIDKLKKSFPKYFENLYKNNRFLNFIIDDNLSRFEKNVLVKFWLDFYYEKLKCKFEEWMLEYPINIANGENQYIDIVFWAKAESFKENKNPDILLELKAMPLIGLPGRPNDFRNRAYEIIVDLVNLYKIHNKGLKLSLCVLYEKGNLDNNNDNNDNKIRKIISEKEKFFLFSLLKGIDYYISKKKTKEREKIEDIVNNNVRNLKYGKFFKEFIMKILKKMDRLNLITNKVLEGNYEELLEDIERFLDNKDLRELIPDLKELGNFLQYIKNSESEFGIFKEPQKVEGTSNKFHFFLIKFK